MKKNKLFKFLDFNDSNKECLSHKGSQKSICVSNDSVYSNVKLFGNTKSTRPNSCTRSMSSSLVKPILSSELVAESINSTKRLQERMIECIENRIKEIDKIEERISMLKRLIHDRNKDVQDKRDCNVRVDCL